MTLRTITLQFLYGRAENAVLLESHYCTPGKLPDMSVYLNIFWKRVCYLLLQVITSIPSLLLHEMRDMRYDMNNTELLRKTAFVPRGDRATSEFFNRETKKPNF